MWLSGINICPKCKGITYRMMCGIFNDLCPDCYDIEMRKKYDWL